MASAYEEWIKKIADAAREEGIERGIEQGIEQGIERGIEQGIEKGIEKGVKKGKRESQMEIALKLLQRGGMAVEEIAELTGLSLKNVQKLVAQKAA